MADSFVFVDEDDKPEPSVSISRAEAFRPARLGLGYTIEMFKGHQEKERERKKLESRLLAKKRKAEEDEPVKFLEIDEDSDDCRSSAIKKKIPGPQVTIEPVLSKSQKKRLRLKRKT